MINLASPVSLLLAVDILGDLQTHREVVGLNLCLPVFDRLNDVGRSRHSSVGRSTLLTRSADLVNRALADRPLGRRARLLVANLVDAPVGSLAAGQSQDTLRRALLESLLRLAHSVRVNSADLSTVGLGHHRGNVLMQGSDTESKLALLSIYINHIPV